MTLAPEPRPAVAGVSEAAVEAVRAAIDKQNPFYAHILKPRPIAEAAAQARQAERDAEITRLAAENDVLRASVANGGGPCVYCTLPRSRWAECDHGFPGCPRGDDAMLCPHVGAELETADRLVAAEARANKAVAVVRKLEWGGIRGGRKVCFGCGEYGRQTGFAFPHPPMGVHAEGCPVAALLSTTPDLGGDASDTTRGGGNG